MGICNTTQKELGGKDLLLRSCIDKTATTANADDEVTVTAHTAVVGDIIKFGAVGANTVINTTNFYFVKEVVDANTIKISSTPSGSAITMDGVATGVQIAIFKLLGGLRSKSLSFSSEAIDITSQESQEWKTMLDGAGIRSVAFSGSGVYTKQEVFGALRTAFLANQLICLMLHDTKNNEMIEGCFKISSLEISGDYDAESQYSISGDSSGPVVFFTAA